MFEFEEKVIYYFYYNILYCTIYWVEVEMNFSYVQMQKITFEAYKLYVLTNRKDNSVTL